MKNLGTKTIYTDRLILRRFTKEDNESMRVNWASDESIQKLYSEPTYSNAQEADGFLSKVIANYSNEDYYRWAIAPKDDSENCIGQIAYFLINEKNHWGEIEYCIGRAYQGKGLMTEAVRAILEFGFKQIGLHKVQVCHKEGNIPSQRVIEKAGFIYEGTLRDYFFMEDHYVSRLYYSMLNEEYEM